MKSKPLCPTLVIPIASGLAGEDRPETTLSMWAALALGSVVALIVRPLFAKVDSTRARTVWLKVFISCAEGVCPNAFSTAGLDAQDWGVPEVRNPWSA